MSRVLALIRVFQMEEKEDTEQMEIMEQRLTRDLVKKRTSLFRFSELRFRAFRMSGIWQSDETI
jgi:hypothetical protein